MDSMAHGLGRKLRRCGFYVLLESNRKLIINTLKYDRSFVAISCGKGFRQVGMVSVLWDRKRIDSAYFGPYYRVKSKLRAAECQKMRAFDPSLPPPPLKSF